MIILVHCPNLSMRWTIWASILVRCPHRQVDGRLRPRRHVPYCMVIDLTGVELESLRTHLTANQCCVTDSIFIIPLIFTFIIAKVIMFRYLNIFIILVIAYHREIVHVIESPSKLDGLTHCIKRFYKCPFFPWLSHRKKFYQMMSSNANSLECTSLLMSAVTRILEIVEA